MLSEMGRNTKKEGEGLTCAFSQTTGSGLPHSMENTAKPTPYGAGVQAIVLH